MKDTLRFLSIIIFFTNYIFFLNSCIMSEEAFLIYLQNNNQARWAKKIPCNKKDWMLWEGITLNLEIWSNCNWSVHFMNFILRNYCKGRTTTSEENLKKHRHHVEKNSLMHYIFLCYVFLLLLVIEKKI